MPDIHHFFLSQIKIKFSFIMFACILCLQLHQSAFLMLSYEMMTNILFSFLKLKL